MIGKGSNMAYESSKKITGNKSDCSDNQIASSGSVKIFNWDSSFNQNSI